MRSLSRHVSMDTMSLSRHISLDAMSVSRHISSMIHGDAEPIGSVVAFEGHPDIISTQLRLLPTSPQILILPSIQCYIPIDELEEDFEAHTWIQHTVDAVQARNETARVFLQGSTPTSKRLVFMNGGTPSAQALCIRAIMKHETEGDDIRAEAIFNMLVKDGMAGLEAHGEAWRRKTEPECAWAGEGAQGFKQQNQRRSQEEHRPRKQSGPQTPQTPRARNYSKGEYGSDDDEYQDPITRAMRAADALDRQTASLQPSNELDLTAPFRPRSMSMPLCNYTDNVGDATPFMVFGGRQRAESDVSSEAIEEEYVPMAPNFAVTHYDEPKDNMALYSRFSDVFPKSPKCVGESYESTPSQDVFTPTSELFSPRSPDHVVYGEASLLDMRASVSKPSLPRVRSLDRVYPDSPKVKSLGITEDGDETDPETPTPTQTRPKSFMVVADQKDPLTRRVNYIDGPKTIVVGPKRTTQTITVAPVPTEKKRKLSKSSYVDRGTDAEESKLAKEPFQPVLPFTEDLAVYFKGDATDALLDAMVEAFKLGLYPILSESDTSNEDDNTETLRGTPEPETIPEVDESEDDEEDDMPQASAGTDDYDPFAYVQPVRPPIKQPRKVAAVPVERPPTPAETPPPSVAAEKNDKIHEFKVAPNQTAVAVQNSLRSVLNIYFPREAQGYNQFQFSLLPELEGLWKPVFREAEPASPGKANRRMDQILAIGSQKGVAKDYLGAITGQLERLGTKPSGLTRSGRLDFRYLLANAMQAFTAQPLTSQTSDNPFNNSYLLATLIIPHLETYLALHSEVRFLLLDYPPEHLPTILALQRLVGSDLMKVAQILDSKSKDRLPFSHIHGQSVSKNSVSSVASSSLSKPLPPSPRGSSDVALSRANFLLTSTASDSEIATFISTIWTVLSEISDFYTPIEPPKESKPEPKAEAKEPNDGSMKIPRKQLKPPGINTTLSAFPRTTGPNSPLSPVPPSDPPPMPAPALPAGSGFPPTFARTSPSSSRAPSFTETIRTIRTLKSLRSKHSRAPSRTSRRRPPTGDGASVFTWDPAEDSDCDQEERRLMPIFMKQRSRKPNSRKALKFLGLA